MTLENIAKTLAANQIQFAHAVAKDIAAYAEASRTAPVTSKETRNQAISAIEVFRCSQIVAQLVLEMIEGDVVDLYEFLAPYVKQKFTERMERNDPLSASEVSDEN